jgi:DNA-binding MarR family transcriptional regulator
MASQSLEVADKPLHVHADAFGRAVLRWSWIERRRFAEELSAFGLTIPQYMALLSVESRLEGCAMHTLAEAARETSATMTGIVDRLVEHELVERHRDPTDRRSVLVFLTERGEQLLRDVESRRAALTNRILSTMSPHDREEMLRLMQLYLDSLIAQEGV